MYFDDAAECVKFLRKEAESCRLNAEGLRDPLQYFKEAADRDRWAVAIEDIMQLARVRKPDVTVWIESPSDITPGEARKVEAVIAALASPSSKRGTRSRSDV